MKKDIKVGDWVRSFFIREDVNGLISGKFYEVVKTNPVSPHKGFYVKDDMGARRYCLTYQDAYLEPGSSWEVFSYTRNLKTILE